MWSFGWNDVALYAISLIGIVLIVVLGQRDFRHKQTIIPAIFIISSLIATIVSATIKPDIIATLFTRAMIFEFANIYVTWRFFNDTK